MNGKLCWKIVKTILLAPVLLLFILCDVAMLFEGDADFDNLETVFCWMGWIDKTESEPAPAPAVSAPPPKKDKWRWLRWLCIAIFGLCVLAFIVVALLPQISQ